MGKKKKDPKKSNSFILSSKNYFQILKLPETKNFINLAHCGYLVIPFES